MPCLCWCGPLWPMLQFEIHATPFLERQWPDWAAALDRVMLIDAARFLQLRTSLLSLFFKAGTARYYDLLNGVRQNGGLEAWNSISSWEGVESTATAL